ncbi:hypothetical protein DFP72DRAFT_303935 [Ephemerocybe angulata]|uniref:Uncharacterized protein n=1 Tax=Ephemerocybe angulata TaxID=980116 RepID=A0A8H6HZF9_9AGAR|nr:hypothetical protein DFP72DRAFT_303935 [Tulosesus angulatus]
MMYDQYTTPSYASSFGTRRSATRKSWPADKKYIKGVIQAAQSPINPPISHSQTVLKSKIIMSKVILVTGGNAGIGYELVKLLASKPEGHKVYLGARNQKSGKEVQDALNAEGLKNVHFIQIDVTPQAGITFPQGT